MAYGDGLRRNRCGVWYWRWVVPADVRQQLGAREVQRSLGTASRREATSQSLALRLTVLGLLEAVRAGVRMDREKMLRELERARASVAAHEEREATDAAEFQTWATERATARAVEQAVGETRALAREVVTEQHRSNARRRQEVEAAHSQHVVAVVKGLQVQPGPLLSVCMAAFMRHKQSTRAWAPKTKERWEFMARVMTEAMGDRPINHYTDEDMTVFLEALRLYPANAQKFPALKGLPFSALIEVEGYDRLSEGTVSDHMGRISGFFKWARNKPAYYLQHNPAEGKTIKQVSRVKRRPFTDAHLVALFSHENFAAQRFMHPHYFWLMPMALLTGMRLNELCQLTLTDFIKVDGVDVIRCADLGDDEADVGAAGASDGAEVAEKRRKNPNATRRVPVHAELIRLGLIRWVERLRETGEAQLFPELHAGRDGHGQAPSKWFGKYRKACGIKGDRVYVFHSFRHAFISGRMNLNIAQHRIAAVAGHETGLITGDTYWGDRDVLSLVEVVNAVGLPEAVQALIPTVEQVTFTKKPARRPPSRLGARKSREQRVSDATERAARNAAKKAGTAAT